MDEMLISCALRCVLICYLDIRVNGRDVDFMCPKMYFNMLSQHESLWLRCLFHVH